MYIYVSVCVCVCVFVFLSDKNMVCLFNLHRNFIRNGKVLDQYFLSTFLLLFCCCFVGFLSILSPLMKDKPPKDKTERSFTIEMKKNAEEIGLFIYKFFVIVLLLMNNDFSFN